MSKVENFKTIGEVREAIDNYDSKIIELLGQRFSCVKEIVKFKQPTKEGVVAKERFNSVIASRREMAEKEGLSPDVIEKVYRELIHYFIDEELKLIKTNRD